MLTGLSQLSVSSVPYGLQLAPYCDGTRARRPRGSQLNYKLAGMVGFEPTNATVKVLCLTDLAKGQYGDR